MLAKKYEMRLNENRLPYLAAVGKTKITDSESHAEPGKIADIIRRVYHAERLPEEHVYLLAFDTKMHLIGLFELSHGTSRESALSPEQVLQRLFLSGASRFCIVHNHPSGDVSPSEADNQITKRIAEAARICGVEFCDHIILAGAHKNTFFSYRENSDLLI